MLAGDSSAVVFSLNGRKPRSAEPVLRIRLFDLFRPNVLRGHLQDLSIRCHPRARLHGPAPSQFREHLPVAGVTDRRITQLYDVEKAESYSNVQVKLRKAGAASVFDDL